MKQVITFATQIRAILGNKEAKIAVMEDSINAAVLTAVKGTDKFWVEGYAEAAKGRGAVAKALVAGFVAVGPIAVFIKPQEDVSKADRAERNMAEADRLTAVFMEAFRAAMPAEPTEEEKKAKAAEKEAAKATALAAEVEKVIAERGLVSANKIAGESDLMAALMPLILNGRLSDDSREELLSALGVPAMIAQAKADERAATIASIADAQAKAAVEKASTAPRRTKKADKEAAPA